jgi:hypothetical protein
MLSVTLDRWSPGFAAVDLIALLRTYHFNLAESHQLASDFVEGRRVSILFEEPMAAERFVDAVRKLNVETFTNRAVSASTA